MAIFSIDSMNFSQTGINYQGPDINPTFSAYIQGNESYVWPIYDTMGTKSIADISKGDRLMFTLTAGNGFDGTAYSGTASLYMVVLSSDQTSALWTANLTPNDPATDIIMLPPVSQGGTVQFSVYYAGNNRYSIAPPPEPITFEIDGSQVNTAYVTDNTPTTEFVARIMGDIYDTTGTVSLQNLTRGNKIVLKNFACDSTFHGQFVNQYTSVNLTVFDQTGQTLQYSHFLYSDSATDYIIFNEKSEGDLVNETVYCTGEHGFSLSEPSDYATGFELDGYSISDMIYTPLDEFTNIGINLLPSGSTAYNPYLGVTTFGLLNANTGYDPDTGDMWVELNGFEAGQTSVQLGLDLGDGTQYTQIYNVTVTVPATDFSIQGVAQGGTISARQGGSAKDYAVQFSPSGGKPKTFAVSSSNTSVATATYANGKITITPIATGNSTLTATMDAGLGSEKVYTYTIAVNPPISNKALGGNAIAFLKAKIAEGGGFTKLTEDAYDTTDQEGNPCLYLGNLGPGCYVIDSEGGFIYVIDQNGGIQSRWYIGGYLYVTEWANPWNSGETDKQVFSMQPNGDLMKYSYYTYDGDWNTNGQARFASDSDVSVQISNVGGQLFEQPTSGMGGVVGAIYRLTQDVTDPDTGDFIGQTAELWFCAGTNNDPSTGVQTYDWVKLYPTT